MALMNIVKLGTAVETIMGQAPAGKDCNRDGVGIPFVKVGEFGFDRPEIREWTTDPKKQAQRGDVLLCVVGATCGKINLGEDCAIGRSVAALRPLQEKITQHYLYYFMQGKVQDFRDGSQGAAQTVISKVMIAEAKIPLPTIPEQQRIVAILDQAFADIEKARANAEKNLKNARELFDSYLQQVFSQWDEGWTTRMMSDKSLLQMVDGDRGHNYPKKSDFKDEGHCLFLSTKNVRPNGFKFQDTVFISEERDNLLRKGRLKRNDVLITTRGTIGNLALFDDSVKYKNIRINSGMLILRPNVSQILPSYLFEIMRSNIVKSQVLAKTSGAAQPQLPIQTLNTFSFPVPESLIEQKEMVLKLQELEKKASMLQAVYLHKLDSLDELKKSLLQKAFSGELTKSKGIAA